MELLLVVLVFSVLAGTASIWLGIIVNVVIVPMEYLFKAITKLEEVCINYVIRQHKKDKEKRS